MIRSARTFFIKYLNRLALMVLVLNIFVCSIPRCGLVLAAIQHSLMGANHDASLSCHDVALEELKGETHIGSGKICECSLLQFMNVLPPSPPWQAFHIVRTLVFITSFNVTDLIADFIPTIEPPYPKMLPG